MKRAIRLSIHSGRLSRDERLHLLLLFRTKATPGLLRNFAPRNDDPARSEAAGGRSQRWRNIKAPPKPFSKLLQNSRVLLQAFPNKSLAVLWDFNGLQVFQTPFDAFQIFRLRPPAFGRILPYFTMQFSRRRFHRGAATQIERILNLTDNPVFGKKYPQFSQAVIGRFRTGLRTVSLDETGLPLFRPLRPLAEDDQASSP